MSNLLTFVTILAVTISAAWAKPSTLKVAVCDPGQAPYAITLPNGSFAGFDVGRFDFPFY